MSESGTIIWRAIVNALIVIIICIPILWLYLFGKPTERGFFCNDESIRHPYFSSTVPAYLLYIIGFVIPLVTVCLVETFGRRKIPQEGTVILGAYRISSSIVNIYFVFVGYVFGLAVCQCITDLIKYAVGRLRPHFLTVCNPDFSGIDCGTEQNPLYVTDYVCRGNADLFDHDTSKMFHRLKEARISFVSGHASFAFQAAVFLIIYLQARGSSVSRGKRKVLIIPFLQFLLIAGAIYTAVTRVMDYKHHAGDVVAGALLGTVVQIVNTIFVMRLFSTKLQSDIMQSSVGVTASFEEDNQNSPLSVNNFHQISV